MDNFGADHNGELNKLISELKEGRDQVHQLQLHLNAPYSSSSSSPESTREILLHNIQSKFDNALSLLKYSTGDSFNSLPHFNSAAALIIPNSGKSESPRSFTASPPHSEDSDRDVEPKLDSATRKRKTTPRWTKQVQVRSAGGVDGTLDDGFSWRKYGQKDILGAKYPRGYYRCTLRHVQGCLATKQVQRSDEDPTIYEITYRGRHTCNCNANNVVNPPPPVTMPQNSEPNIPDEHVPHQNTHEAIMNLKRDLNLDHFNFHTTTTTTHEPAFASYNFASSSDIKHDVQDYSFVPNMSTMIHSNNFVDQSFTPSFMSSAGGTSGSSTSYMATSSPSQMNSAFGGQQNGLDYQFSSMGFESNFPFDY